jgi:uncharacterized protein (TIGR00251 family)
MSADAAAVQIVERAGGVELSVKVVPGSSRNQIAGVWDTSLRLAVTAPPEGGKANKQVVRLVADAFDVKRSDVTIVHGHTQPLKRVRIENLTAEQARQTLAALLDAAG